MGLTRERKVFLGVMGLAAVALVVDQGLMAPGGAKASPVGQTPETAASDGVQSASLGGQATGSLVGMVSDRLLELAEGEGIDPSMTGDGFRLVGMATEPEAEASFPIEAREPSAALSLSVCMPNGGGGGIAVINGKRVRLGEQIEGFRLVRVETRRVVLARGDRLFSLGLGPGE